MKTKNKGHNNDTFEVLLYYCYTPIDDPEQLRREHALFCVANALKGRIIISEEGINGTLSGRLEDTARYKRYLKEYSCFREIDFKTARHHQHAFEKLHVRVKKEIVRAGLPNLFTYAKRGDYISAKALRRLFEEERGSFKLLDVRAKYEHTLGKFEDTLTLAIENFRDFATKAKTLQQYKKEKIITYCTGGVRCEKASAFLLAQGFEKVYQLHGGIIKYGMETDGKYFTGSCYVFDNRICMPVSSMQTTLRGVCFVCKKPCERMINCANPSCNKHVPVCEDCGEKKEGCCSTLCQKNPSRRTYNGTGYYVKKSNGYNPLVANLNKR